MKYSTLILLLIFSIAKAQSTFNSGSFEVTKDDLELMVFEKDSTANSLVIREEGKSYFYPKTHDIHSEITKKLKILNQNGFKNAEVSIPLYVDKEGKKEKVKNIKASVYNIENGKIIKTKLKKISVFEETFDENHNIFKIAFPKVKKGTVIVYSYKIVSPFTFKFKEWNFQDDIPKLYSEYNTNIPTPWEYHAKLVGSKKLTINESITEPFCYQISTYTTTECVKNKYVMKDIPAFIEEDYMTTKDNYLARIEYELKTYNGIYNKGFKHFSESWEDVDNQIQNETELGKELFKTDLIKNILPNSIKSLDDNFNKAEAILNFIKSNYSWNGENNIFTNVSIENLLKNKSGNVSEINTLLYLLLKENNINVEPLITSTRENGFITVFYPVITDFNYLIIKTEIDGKSYLLDATDNYLSFGEIPFRCLNHFGRVLDFVQGSHWYDIIIDDTSLLQYSYVLNIDENQNITGNVDFEATGHHALPIKKVYFENSERFEDNLKNKFNTIEFSNIEVATTEKTSKEFIAKFDIQKSTDLIGNTVYLNPIVFEFFSKNPFNLQERSYPIDFGYKDTYIYKIKVKVDESFNVLEIPEAVNLTLPNRDASILFTAQKTPDEVMLYFKLSFNKDIYDSQYYEALKEIMSKVVDIQNNALIVLEKKQ